jgi:hypothetical protein
LSYLIVVKEGDHAALFEAVQAGKTEDFEYQDPQGVLRGFRYLNAAPLNKSHPDLLVNDLDYGKSAKAARSPVVFGSRLSRDHGRRLTRG